MLRLTWAQMRRSLGRLTAAAVAIAIGTAFVATTLIAGNVMTRTGYDAVTATYADADVVLYGEVSDTEREAVGALPQVEAVGLLAPVGFEVRKGGTSRWQVMLPTIDDPRLSSLVVEEGSAPVASGEIALPASTAEALGVGVGDHVQVRWSTSEPAEATSDEPTPSAAEPAEVWRTVDDDVVVTGIASDPASAWAANGGAGLVTAPDTLRWSDVESLSDLGSTVLVTAEPGVPVVALQDAIDPVVSDDAQVLTRDEAAELAVAQFSDGGNVLLTIVLGFAAVALLVAALVIANTFQVLVAQRTRTLALLRCVGAGKGQLRRSVLLEAAILGAAASVAGLVLGLVLGQSALMILGRLSLGVPLPSTIQVTPPVVLLPLLVGTVVTVLASLVPAREATRVSPIAALRPAEAPAVGARGGRVRLAFSLLLTVGGVGVMLLAALASSSGRADQTLMLGVGALAGGLSFVGVLVGAVFWVPRVVSLVGRALASTGTSARLAAANTVRNPRRTAATSAALLIGATLVAMMSTGAASARVSLAQELDEHYPVDLMVDATVLGDTASLPSDVREAVAAVTGVDSVLEMRTGLVMLDDTSISVAAPADGSTTTVLRNPRTADGLSDATLLLPKRSSDLATSGTTPMRGHVWGTDHPEPVLDGSTVDLRVVPSELGGVWALVTPATLERLAPQAPVSMLWVRLDPGADAALVLQEVRAALPDTPAEVYSAGAERSSNERVINSLLAIVVGLLGVAVVIALIGVANTLSLSVLERRRESATLRAIGLSRRQLRIMLAVEGMLIAGVGAVLGAALGLLYGWAGAKITFGQIGDVVLVIPWRDLGLLFLVALGAGLLASVLPGRAAARTSPVAALAVD